MYKKAFICCPCRFFIFFFFSSRRRHTRFDCDWSSDVCSSDLLLFALGLIGAELSAASLDKAMKDVERLRGVTFTGGVKQRTVDRADLPKLLRERSEERRVGKECRCRWSPYR